MMVIVSIFSMHKKPSLLVKKKNGRHKQKKLVSFIY